MAGDEYYQKFFYLRPGKDGGYPNNWQSKFGGPAWSKFGDTDLYYLHLYDKTQADLDWHNPAVRKELFEVVNFWRQKGVHGFRFDVINVTGKDTVLVDSTNIEQEKRLYTDTPVVQDYLRELNAQSFGQDPEAITVGEMSSTTIPNSIAYTKPENHELSMTFAFHHLKTDYMDGQKWTQTPFDFQALKHYLLDWQEEIAQGGGWQALFWNNHDQPWALNRFGDPGQYRVKSAEMMAATIHLMRGTPYIYMGEELGMVDPSYQSMAEYVDVEAQNAYQELVAGGRDPQEAFAIVHSKARDNSRVPMHWDASQYAGFSQVKPWLMPTDQAKINVHQELTSGEIFAFYQQLIALRKQDELVSNGQIHSILRDHDQVLAYVRSLPERPDQLAVFSNFYGQETTVVIPAELRKAGEVVVTNYGRVLTSLAEELTLQPYETLAFRTQ